MNFTSFFSRQYKRDLIKTLHYGIKTIFPLDVVEEEKKALYITLKENGHLEKFMTKHLAKKRE